jgi:2-polyprenyl-3-methyl-5-hydroxy-6-metoxy-1,4-benzoquinol methylase
MSGIYDESYYNTNNYETYIKRGRETDHYNVMAQETLDLLHRLNRKTDVILDFGCALGFMLEQFEKRSIDAVGVDVSEFARKTCVEKGFVVTEEPLFESHYDVMYALDVLEHLDEDDLTNLFEQIKCDTVVYKLPVAEVTDGKYVLDCAEDDKTHKIRWTHEDWRGFFSHYGYFCIDVNLTKIYASEGGFCGIAIKYK